jgi:hypothetical protein
MKDRFDLEQQIMECWAVVDDLKMLVEANQINVETINSIITLYNIKFEQTFETFAECIRNNKIYTAPVLSNSVPDID